MRDHPGWSNPVEARAPPKALQSGVSGSFIVGLNKQAGRSNINSSLLCVMPIPRFLELETSKL